MITADRRCRVASSLTVALVLECWACLVWVDPAAAAPTIDDVKLSSPSVACFGRLEITFRLAGSFSNPFDPREIEADGHFVSPDGKPVVMPAFLYQDCRRRLGADGKEKVELSGAPCWKVRFAPTRPGRWQVAIRARDRSGQAESGRLTFEATASAGHGYIRRAPGNDYFAYGDGTPFFPIGENIAWAGKRGTCDFDDWIPAAGKAGINLARIWLQWNDVLSIEHKGSGAGRYDLANAWRMDHVLDLSRQHGVRVLFTCDSPEPYQKEHRWLGKLTSKPWENCPHNAANGGPLREPNEFYTTEEGHRLIRQRLRYIVARWGWDPNIFCWELWNELNCFPGWDRLVPEIAKWHVEMAGVLRSLDPNQHLVTTSFGFVEGHEGIWKLPELDFVQSHSYGATDMAAVLTAATTMMKQRYRRPHLIGEFGPPLTAEMLGSVFKIDAQGLHIHNAIWSTALGGGAGTGLTWWWDNYIHPNRLYPVFTPLAKFCEKVPWTTAGFQPARAAVSWIKPPPPRPPRDLTLECRGSPPVTDRLVLDPRDPLPSIGRFYLYGKAQRDQQKPVVVELDRAVAGPMTIRIGRVWVLGLLDVKLDGKPILHEEFPAGPGAGPWKKSELDPRWKIWGADYQKDITIPVPAGRHCVELSNAGKDGITIDRISLAGYLTDDRPPVRCIGLTGQHESLLWVQNKDRTLASLMEKRTVAPVVGARLTLAGIPAGPCTVEWWDTQTGAVTKTSQEQAVAEGLVLPLPALAWDVALKVRW